MKKIKQFYWNNVGSVPTIVRNDMFVNHDNMSNYISIVTNKEYDGKDIRLYILDSSKITNL